MMGPMPTTAIGTPPIARTRQGHDAAARRRSDPALVHV